MRALPSTSAGLFAPVKATTKDERRPEAPAGLRCVQLKTGPSFVPLWPAITALRFRCRVQDDVLLDPLHFLASTSEARRSCAVACWDGDRLAGVFFAFEHWSRGVRTGYAAAGDYSGRGLVLCEPDEEAAVVQCSVACLFQNGIHSLELRHTPHAPQQWHFAGLRTRQFEAVIPGDHLPLPLTYEEFLQGLGGHTRKHARYYRRKALECGMTFDPSVSDDEFYRERVRLNHTTRFPLSRLHLDRDDRLLLLHGDNYKFGLRDSAGVLVALVCGFIKAGRVHLLTQWNDPAHEKLSLSLVLRGFMIEHLIGMGCREVFFIGGSTLFFGRLCKAKPFRLALLERERGVTAWFKRAVAWYSRRRAASGSPLPLSVDRLSGAFLHDEGIIARTMLNVAFSRSVSD